MLTLQNAMSQAVVSELLLEPRAPATNEPYSEDSRTPGDFNPIHTKPYSAAAAYVLAGYNYAPSVFPLILQCRYWKVNGDRRVSSSELCI